ncbi:MAG: DUF2269 domain-containing protein [Spirochaetales bacterium]|nr:DUF2269 domain-containing protein [Spirochaetales bacterium]
MYLLLKLIHILSATLLFGAGMASAYALLRAHRTGERRRILVTLDQVIHADLVFTAPAGLIQFVTGWWMMHLAGFSFTGWLVQALFLYAVALLTWLPAAFLQARMRKILKGSTEEKALPPGYLRSFRVWAFLGLPSFTAMVLLFYIMVFKRLPLESGF